MNSIGGYTFQNAEINRVSFEEGIRVLPAYLFNECDSIEEIRNRNRMLSELQDKYTLELFGPLKEKAKYYIITP